MPGRYRAHQLAACLALLPLSFPVRAQPGAMSAEELSEEAGRAFEGQLGFKGLERQLGPDWPAKLKAAQSMPTRVIQAPCSLVDLHAHLFMENGLGFMFNGEFDQPLQANDWSDRFSSKINAATMETSNLGVVVVALYAHPILEPARKSALRAQIAQAEAFVASHPQWIIARSPEDVLTAYRQNKRSLVLSIEGASGLVDTKEGMDEFIERRGVRIVTFAHLTDDNLSGAAFMDGIHMLGNPQGVADSLFSPVYDHGVQVNPHGLTKEGREVARELIRRHVWIDLAHATDAAQRELIPMMEAAGQPLLYTHTELRRHKPSERAISDIQLSRVRATGGIIGLVPAESSMEGTPAGICQGGLFGLATQYSEAAKVIGAASVFLGSDFDGAMDHLKPSNCATHTSLDRESGFYNIGQTSELWWSLKQAGAPVMATAEHGVENFAAVWSKVFEN